MIEGITIVTLSYKRPDLFCRMADALPRADDRIIERILVNNGGDGITAAEAERRGWIVLEPHANLSFSAGCNLGVQKSVSSHVVLLNNDAILTKPAIAALWSERANAIVGCQIRHSDGRVNFAGGAIDPPDFIPMHMDRGADPATVPGGMRFTPWATFACVQITRRIYALLGGLDEAYRYGFEDVDFCLRARERGVQTSIALDAVVTHDEMSTRTAANDQRNFETFWRRWHATGRLQRVLA